MTGQMIRALAHDWMRAHGAQTEWHLRRKIEKLSDWGDDQGAHLFEQVLAYCNGLESLQRSRSNRLRQLFSRLAALLRGSSDGKVFLGNK